jgi:hypothetical protein
MRSRHPVISAVTVRPVARRPDQVGFGTDGLFVDRQCRRCEADADTDSVDANSNRDLCL